MLIPIYDLNIGRRRAGDDRTAQQSQNTRNLYDLHNQFLTWRLWWLWLFIKWFTEVQGEIFILYRICLHFAKMLNVESNTYYERKVEIYFTTFFVKLTSLII